MYQLTLENKNGNQLEFNKIGGDFTITNIEGLNPPDATINTNTVALLDGERFNSAKIKMRTLNIAFMIEYDAEKNRRKVYQVARMKDEVLVSYKSDTMDVFIYGRITKLNISYFDMKQLVTLSIICPSPYWKSAQSIINDMSNVEDMFHFPFYSQTTPEIVFGEINPVRTIFLENEGYVETGLTIVLYSYRTVKNPIIYNYDTKKFIGLEFTMEAGDEITITTTPGDKKITLLRQGMEINLINYLIRDSKWLQLPPGGNNFTYTVDEFLPGSLSVKISYYNLYEGV